MSCEKCEDKYYSDGIDCKLCDDNCLTCKD